jgi:hypothetical protein
MAKAKPQRMQLSRHRGFNLQAESEQLNGLPAKRVTRPGSWGNPFTVADMQAQYGLDADAAQVKAVELCGRWLRRTLDRKLWPGEPPSHEAIRRELKGYNLACWCLPGTPCHSEVLIEIANGAGK